MLGHLILSVRVNALDFDFEGDLRAWMGGHGWAGMDGAGMDGRAWMGGRGCANQRGASNVLSSHVFGRDVFGKDVC